MTKTFDQSGLLGQPILDEDQVQLTLWKLDTPFPPPPGAAVVPWNF
jgi:hypothetical protein